MIKSSQSVQYFEYYRCTCFESGLERKTSESGVASSGSTIDAQLGVVYQTLFGQEGGATACIFNIADAPAEKRAHQGKCRNPQNRFVFGRHTSYGGDLCTSSHNPCYHDSRCQEWQNRDSWSIASSKTDQWRQQKSALRESAPTVEAACLRCS